MAGLVALHWAQLTEVVFENLDIAMGRSIDPAPQRVFAKLVTAGRGGYCHECNGLLLQALAAFGFAARPLVARVMQGPDSPVTGHSRTLTLVELPEGQFLTDAGFGAQTPRVSLLLQDGQAAGRGDLTWRLDRDQGLVGASQSPRMAVGSDSTASISAGSIPPIWSSRTIGVAAIRRVSLLKAPGGSPP